MTNAAQRGAPPGANTARAREATYHRITAARQQAIKRERSRFPDRGYGLEL